MMFDICDAMKLTSDECTIFPMNGDLNGNAVATFADRNRIIVYDRTLSRELGYEGAMAVIAHEVGHHFCGHLTEPSSPKHELEADRFAGGAMRNAGMSLDAALSMSLLFSNRAGRTHPSKADREAAIKSGWHEPVTAKKC